MRQALTLDDVVEIAADFLSGETSMAELARERGVSHHTVREALDGLGAYAKYQRYLPVADIKAMLEYRRRTTGACKLTIHQVVRLRQSWVAGTPMDKLCKAYRMHQSAIYRIVRGDCYRLAGGPTYRPLVTR